MAALQIQAFARDVRREDALITGGELGFFRQLFQFLGDDCAARQEHRQPGSDVVVENKQLEFASELPMIALLRFLQHREVVVEFFFGFERRAVNALKLRICFVAFVVRAGNIGQLECADVSRAHHVRPGAEIDELAVAIERNFFVCRNILDDVQLEFAWLGAFAQRREPAFFAELERFIPRNLDPFERMVRFDFVFHLGLDLFEIIG